MSAFFKKKVKPIRSANLGSGRLASNNSYYRPARTNPAQSIKVDKITSDAQSSRKRLSLSQVVNFVIIACFVGLFFFASTLSSTPDINITKDSFMYRSVPEYQKKASEMLSNNPLSASKLLFKSGNFEEKMRNEFPEINQIQAIIPLGGRDLSVAMHLSAPLATVYSGDKSGVLDNSGVLVTDKIPDQQDLLKVRFATPQDNFQVGSRLLTSREVEQLNLLSSELSSLALGAEKKPLQISEALFNINDGQIEVKLKDKPYYLKLSTYAEAREQVGAIKSILQRLDKEGTAPVRYIDARVPGRVFVV
jgi:hypothetical protein